MVLKIFLQNLREVNLHYVISKNKATYSQCCCCALQMHQQRDNHVLKGELVYQIAEAWVLIFEVQEA